MKRKKLINIIILSSLIIFFFSNSCNEFEEPSSISEPTLDYAASPVITNLAPDAAIAGVRYIEILGSNFAVNSDDTTYVYIGGEKAQIKSITSQQIVVDRPVNYGDNVAIRVMVPSALAVGKIDNYKIEVPISDLGDFSRENYDLTAIAVAPNDELYLATRRAILHLSSDGVNLTEIANLGSTFATITDMKFGPGGYLYLLVGKRDIYRLNPAVGTDEHYADLSENADYFDFDENNNIFLGDRDGLWVVNTDKTETFTGYHEDAAIKCVRVYNGYVYVATAKTLSRNQILNATGSIGTTEQVVDLEDVPGFAGADIGSFTMDLNGMMLLCLKQIAGNSLFVLEDDYTITPYYSANILPSSVDQIIYGRDRYMYLNRGITLGRDSVRVHKMGMQFKGAPYLGRE